MARARVMAAAGLLLALAMLRPWLEARMTTQMLLQIPLLVYAGVLLGRALPARWHARLAPWNRAGVSGAILAASVGAVWMLPRLLDAAVTAPLVDAAKHLSLPLLAGIPLALSWPRAGFIVRGVLLLELVASCFRLGWLYLISPVRLCNNYALADQQQLGALLLALGALLSGWVVWKLLWRGIDAAGPADRLRE